MLSNYAIKVLWEAAMTRIVNALERGAKREDFFDRDTDFTPFSLQS